MFPTLDHYQGPGHLNFAVAENEKNFLQINFAGKYLREKFFQ